MPDVHVSNHPLIRHKLTLLRDQRTEPKKFRELVREIAILLAYEATADLAAEPTEVATPLATTPRSSSSCCCSLSIVSTA